MASVQDRIEVDFDPKALKAKYLEERNKRMRADGNRQYQPVDTALPSMLENSFDKTPVAREPIQEDVDVLIVGGGMSGLMTASYLKMRGVENIRILEAAGDFGGTWYWNRYPGAQCDTEAYIYMPLLEETGYVPTEKYARAPELFAHFQRIGQHFGLTEKALFKTKAEEFKWDEVSRRWIVKTDRGDEIHARFISFGVGSLTQPKLPGVPGLNDFKGHIFLTSRWDYGYTGGSPADRDPQLTRLADKRVAIVGTGCTAIQATPQLAKHAKEVFVFQRTPSMINHRGNRQTDDSWKAHNLKPGWQIDRMRNFEANIEAPSADREDLIADGWTHLARSLFDLNRLEALVENGQAKREELAQFADFITMEGNRARVADIVKDPAAAEALKPWYNVHCKRPTFHDEFLPAFNEPNVTLVDTSGKGVERISEKGIVVDGKEYEVDCIIFATGFEANSLITRSGHFSVTGVNGRSLEEKWSKQFSTLHGVFLHGFPNMSIVGQIRDGGGSFNATFPFRCQAIHVAEIVADCLRDGVTKFEVTQAAEDGWRKTMAEKQMPLGDFLAECTPGYLNAEGNPDEPALRTSIYGGGGLEFERLLEEWRHDGIKKDAVMDNAVHEVSHLAGLAGRVF